MAEKINPSEEELPRRVVVKFQKEFDIPYQDGAEEYLTEEYQKLWESLSADFPGVRLKRLYIVLEPERIRELVAKALQLDSAYEDPNFFTFFVIDVPPGSNPFALAEAISSPTWEIVDYAYVESLPVPSPTVPTGQNPLLPDQFYLDPPNSNFTDPNANIGGINAHYAWQQGGGSGSGMTFLDVEKGWLLDHPDLVDPNTGAIIIDLVAGVNYSEKDHGTAVLGILAAQDNPINPAAPQSGGGVGIAYQANAKVVSTWRPRTPQDPNPNLPDPVYDIANALLSASDILDFGDVLLLEVQIEENGILLPVEKQNFEDVRLATALGIVVVEPAGNEGVDLAPHITRDSGAILVAAVNATGPLIGRRSFSSNFGSRINCYAWGNQVQTATDPAISGNEYTSGFGGTSGAAAIVAGAAVLVQSMAQNNPSLGYRFSPWQLRHLLQSTGTSPVVPTDPIGTMPNLGTVINNFLNPPADIYVRDNPADDGEPHTGPLAASPDVNVFTSTGAGNGSLVTAGGDHEVRVSVRNRGGTLATGARATVYWAQPSMLPAPASWTLIGTSPAPTNVPAGMVTGTALDPVPWPANALPAPGHYCFIATIGCNEDPDPVPNHQNLVLLDFDDFLDFIRNNNNITWRNFNVEAMSATGTMMLNFMAAGWPRHKTRMSIEIGAHLPEGSKLKLEGPESFIEIIIETGNYLEKSDRAGEVRLPINPYAVNRFREIDFPADFKVEIRLLVDIPDENRGHPYQLYARQLCGDDEVGRVTWQLVPNEHPNS